MRFVYYYIIILLLFCSCYSKEGLREQVISLYEQGKQWEESEHADSAASCYLRSFQLAKKLKDDSLAGKVGNTLGDILNLQSLYSNALSIHREAYLYNVKLEDKTSASHSLRGIGKDYMLNMPDDSTLYRINLDSALIYFNRAKSLIPQIINQEEISLINNNLCVYYTTVKDFSRALDYNQEAILAAEDCITIYRNYFCRGNIFYSLMQYDSAIFYCKEAMKSSNLYTQYAGCYQLANTFVRIGSPDSATYFKIAYDIYDKIAKQSREEEIMILLQKSNEDHLIKKRMIVFFCIIFVLILISFSIFILYRKCNRKKLLKKDHVIFSQQEELVTEQKQTRNLRNELEDSKQIINYAELKEEKQEEEAKNISNIIQLGEECVARFQKKSFYKNTKKRLNKESDFTKGEREVLYQKVSKCFNPYIKEVNKCIQLADEDYFVCCLTLLGFSTKYCAVCRGVGEAGIRVQRKRIKDKLKAFFHSDELCNSIFDRKNNNSIH